MCSIAPRRSPVPPRRLPGRGWLLVGLVLVAGACAPWGEPEFVAEGSLWIDPGPTAHEVGFTAPARPNPWIQLLRSYRVLDEVVVEEGLARGEVTPREAARELSRRLRTRMHPDGRFLQLSLTGTDPEEVRSVLDAVMERHVEVAATLERARHEEMLENLEAQRDEVARDLERAELELSGAHSGADQARLARRVRMLDDLHAQLALRTESVRLEARWIIPDVRILAHASVSGQPRSHGTYSWLIVLLGLVAALVGGVLLAARSQQRLGGTAGRGTGDLTSILAILLGSALAAVLTALAIG